MEEASAGRQSRWAVKPFALWVIFAGLVYTGVAFLVTFLPLLASAITDPFGLIFVIYIALFLAGGFLSLTGRRWALGLAAGLSIFFIVLFAPFIAGSLANPADPTFPLAISGIPALILVAGFSILSLVYAKGGIARKRYLASVRSGGGLVTLAVVGFVVGGLVAGTIGGAVISGLLKRGCAEPNVCIAQGAFNPQHPEPFAPETKTIRAGESVTWYNSDALEHTVTSDTAGLFESGLIASGASWNYTFTTAGTYPYHCTPHPSMTGTIIVTP